METNYNGDNVHLVDIHEMHARPAAFVHAIVPPTY